MNRRLVTPFSLCDGWFVIPWLTVLTLVFSGCFSIERHG